MAKSRSSIAERGKNLSKQASNFIRQNNEKNTNILLNNEYCTFGRLPVKLSLILAGHPFY